VQYHFDRRSFGPPILSEVPYLFRDALIMENEMVIGREDGDPVYRAT
jgi:hypothetical protein